jgi:type IV pilus assembly protein PilV
MSMTPMTRTIAKPANGGFALLEVLITLLIVLVGLLSLAGLQAKMVLVNRDSMQRSQAILLLQDMASRIKANRSQTANYVTTSPLGVQTSIHFNPSDCSTLTGYQLDQCQWSRLLQGAAETLNGNDIGAMEGARGCIYSLGTNPDALRVVVVWQGATASTDPLAGLPVGSGRGCGSGDYGSNSYRRAVFTDVIIPTLD